MISTPRLLDQLVNLTSIRDLELLEVSLLRTLRTSLLPRNLSLLRLNTKGRPILEMVDSGERCSIEYEDLQLTKEFERADEYLTSTTATHYSIPLVDGLLNVFALMSTPAGRSYLQISTNAQLSEPDLNLMAGVLQIYRNFFTLMQQAQTDQLTGLANRKTFEKCVAKLHDLVPEDEQAPVTERRGLQPLNYWLVMVDIDHFKSVNDRFGHLFGDEVLVTLSQLMKESFRENDMIFRFGGEEFVIIVRCSDQDSCRATLERFRVEVENRSIPQIGAVTISLGVTRMARETFTATLVDYADQALYHSKRNGRNRVTFFEELLAQGLGAVEAFKSAEVTYF
jgi:diguanylate cyclase (GGDEF)-like protein